VIFDGVNLTPATKEEAGPGNYTWWNGKGEYPIEARYVFTTKEAMAEQVYRDFNGKLPPPRIINGPVSRGENTVIGGNGFGWYGDPPVRFPHIGGVRFGDSVEIGSCVTIDRGSIDDTSIGNYVKIDNGVHVGHNASIGDSTKLAAHCVIGGSAKIGAYCWIGLGAQIKNQITIGDHVTVGMGAIVVKDVPDNVTVIGNPARIME